MKRRSKTELHKNGMKTDDSVKSMMEILQSIMKEKKNFLGYSIKTLNLKIRFFEQLQKGYKFFLFFKY